MIMVSVGNGQKIIIMIIVIIVIIIMIIVIIRSLMTKIQTLLAFRARTRALL